jgi:hypothetical protein
MKKEKGKGVEGGRDREALVTEFGVKELSK